MPTNTSTNRLVGATFDDAGNLTNITLGQQQQFDYDGLGMLKTQQTPTGVRAYLYDASDERVMRWDCPLDECGPDTSREHITIRGLNGEVLRIYEGTERADRKWKEDTIYRDGQPLIRIQDAGQGTQKLHALHHDHLGSVRQVTNWLGEEVSRHRYYPFGKEATPVASSDPNHKFTGHERDEGFQAGEPLDYMHARYCSPVLGRFLSVDPVSGDPQTPQGWNRYSYVRNRPLNYTDPTGEVADIAVDIGFIVYDLGDIATTVIAGEGVSGEQLLALTADLVGAAVPFATGGGLAVRAAGKADDAADAARSTTKALTESSEVSRGVGLGRRTSSGVNQDLGTIHVDPKGNALPTPRGGTVTGSPDGRYLQVRDATGRPTGIRIDGPHSPTTHSDPRARAPHAHVPGITNPDGTPWLPIKD